MLDWKLAKVMRGKDVTEKHTKKAEKNEVVCHIAGKISIIYIFIYSLIFINWPYLVKISENF